jgi:hypothetical protein
MDRQMAFVLLEQPVVVDIEAVAQAIRKRYPSLPVEVVAAPANGQRMARSPLIRCDGELIALMNVAAPLPKEPGEDVWVRAAKTWPQALAVLLSHRAHFIVATMGKVESPLREARLVTAVVGAALDAVSGCSAVMWAGRVARPAALWREQSRAACAAYPDYPILLWVDIVPVRTASGIDAVTIGLSSFIDREIEFEVGRLNPSDVLNRVAGLACYLVEHGNVVKDGDTFGDSELERIKIRHAVSKRLGGVPVLQVAAEGRDLRGLPQ